MKLLFMRHADAASRQEAGVLYDRERPITELGREQTADVAEFLQKTGISPGTILHSPALRCTQTAAIIAQAFDRGEKIFPAPELAGGCGAEDILNTALIYGDVAGWILFVLHEPDLSFLLATWVGDGKSSPFFVQHADLFGFHCLDHDRATFDPILFFSPSRVKFCLT